MKFQQSLGSERLSAPLFVCVCAWVRVCVGACVRGCVCACGVHLCVTVFACVFERKRKKS